MEKNLKIKEISRGDFNDLVDSINSVIEELPDINYNELHDELRNSDYLKISLSPSPSLDELSNMIVKVQAAKDRVSQIFLDAERNYKILKHYSKSICNAWIRLSGDSSQDKRESDAITRTWVFLGASAEAEALYFSAKTVLENLKDKWDTISRFVSIIELQYKLREIGSNNPIDKLSR